MGKKFLVLTMLVLGLNAQAQEAVSITGESEASAILVNGSVKTEAYTAKTKNTYALTESDLFTGFGSYLMGKTAGNETAKSWEAGLRYEHVFMKDLLTGFVQHKAESDPYNGKFIQRDSTDVGAKYYFIKSTPTTWFGELGYRYSTIYANMETDKEGVSYARIYTEASHQYNETVAVKLWIEHLPPFKTTTIAKALTNAELSLSVKMSSILSLKTAYLLNRNEAGATEEEKNKTTWTTALVAKY